MSAKTILYVEDNEVNRRLVRDLLKRTSYRLLEAPDGETGVAVARQERPDLILMDVQLPRVSGIEATRTLRGEPATAETPIIAITSFALGGDEQKAREAGATAYLAKPYSPRELLEMIRRLLPEDQGGGMKTAVRALLVAALACASGCAHSDWIEGTLVTVDVTGTWQSTAGGLFVLALEQQGARVKGSIQMLEMTALAHLSGPIDGTVAGDTFSFRGANGSVTGKTTVSEDEMIGSVEMRATNMSIRRSINLRRVDSSARPRSQQP